MAMVRQSHSAAGRLGTRRGARGSGSTVSLQNLLVLIVAAIAALCLTMAYYLINAGSPMSPAGEARMRAAARQKKRLIPSIDNAHNAIAMDIMRSLSCDTLGEEQVKKDGVETGEGAAESGRRLAEVAEGLDAADAEGGEEEWMMGDDLGNPMYAAQNEVNAKHLMCLVAGATKLPSHISKDSFHCDALGTRREALLDVWSSARSQMPLDVIQTTLGLATESEKTLVDNTLQIWAPWNDESVEFLQTTHNDENSGIRNLESVLGTGRLFVDIGSGLGLSSLAAALLYPGTTVLSVEPAAPSWLLSRLNFVCNLPPESKLPNPVLAGVGPKNDGMGKMMWRPSSTGTTRAWTPKAEKRDDDLELIVRLRLLRSILAEAAAEEDLESDPPLNVVVNLDCEGCEYNLVPALSDGEFDAIDTFIGTTGVHWGYIPVDKLPSSERGKKTHERLCRHYDFARQSIECCDFPDLKVKRPEHVDKPTVSEVAGDLCSNFKAWAADKGLYESTDDYGWSELSSMSDI